MVNAALLKEVREYIGEHPEDWNQAEYQYCFAGWALRLHHGIEKGRTMHYAVDAEAQRLLGIEGMAIDSPFATATRIHASVALFHGTMTLDLIDQVIERILAEDEKEKSLTPA